MPNHFYDLFFRACGPEEYLSVVVMIPERNNRRVANKCISSSKV